MTPENGSLFPFFLFGKHALARTRTATPCGTTPSRWRVYQFHHQGRAVVHLRFSFQCELLEDRNGRPIRIAFDCELSNTGATGLEPATSRVTVECSNQTELRPQQQPQQMFVLETVEPAEASHDSP